MYQYFFTFLLAITGVSLAKSIKIVPQGAEALVENFGNYDRKKLKPGLTVLIPFVEEIAHQETLCEQVFSLPPQQFKTSDLATVTVEFNVRWRIIDLEIACYKVRNFKRAMLNVLLLSIQTHIAKLTVDELIDELYGSRNQLDRDLVRKLNAITVLWGVKFAKVELRDCTSGTQSIQQIVESTIDRQKFKSSSNLADIYGCLKTLATLTILATILAAIALPAFLSSANKAKQSEAKQYVSSMNRGQQAYYAENSAFSNSIAALGLGIKTETTNYQYSTLATKTAAFQYGLSKVDNLKDYVGAVFVVRDANGITTSAILCESITTSTIKPAEPTYQNSTVICGEDTTLVTK